MWTDQLTAQPGNFAPILQTITQADGLCLQEIYDTITAHAENNGFLLWDYIVGGFCVSLQEQIEANGAVNLASIATLKAVGVIMSIDNVHIGITPLGYGFMESVS